MFDLIEIENERKRTLTTVQLKDFKAAVGACEICGKRLPISVLDHHHIKPKGEAVIIS